MFFAQTPVGLGHCPAVNSYNNEYCAPTYHRSYGRSFSTNTYNPCLPRPYYPACASYYSPYYRATPYYYPVCTPASNAFALTALAAGALACAIL